MTLFKRIPYKGAIFWTYRRKNKPFNRKTKNRLVKKHIKTTAKHDTVFKTLIIKNTFHTWKIETNLEKIQNWDKPWKLRRQEILNYYLVIKGRFHRTPFYELSGKYIVLVAFYFMPVCVRVCVCMYVRAYLSVKFNFLACT